MVTIARTHFASDAEWAQALAGEWIDAWNAHDLERILSHYAEGFDLHSPLIRERMQEPSGVLVGKQAIRAYWQLGLAAQPPLRFELLAVHLGIDSVAISYRSVGRRLAVEVLQVDAEGVVTSASAHYGLESAPPRQTP